MKHVLFVLVFVFSVKMATAADWQPAKGPLKTRWAAEVSADRVLPEYPRPQMVRKDWQNLNGLWEYALLPKADGLPKRFEGQIMVPFPVESALSGVMKRVGQEQRLWYRRTFSLAGSREGRRTLLHFGAVDWETIVWVNGKPVGEHRGGYDPFSFDITDALGDSAEQEIVVAVWDPSDAGPQPRGKQVNNPGGIYYTPSTGIWQTVWLEAVPTTYIQALKIVPDVENKSVQVTVSCQGDDCDQPVNVVVTGASAGTKRAATKASGTGRRGEAIAIQLDDPRLWSPDEPWLHDLTVSLGSADNPADRVTSYFGMRKVSLGKDDNGVTRIFLNGKPLFMFGPLDQGFWPDGLYTAPTDEALRYDVELTRQVGFNMCRKHVKVEPARWYYWCDKLGLLVWQDMPSGDKSVGPGK